MSIVTSKAIKQIKYKLQSAYAPEFLKVFCENHKDRLVIECTFSYAPSFEQLENLKKLLFCYVDKIVPYNFDLPAWSASLVIDSKFDGDLISGRTRIGTLEGGSKKFPQPNGIF